MIEGLIGLVIGFVVGLLVGRRNPKIADDKRAGVLIKTATETFKAALDTVA